MTDFAFPGLNLAVTTPFDPDGRVAFDRLEEHLERYIAAGIPGFVLSSGTGLHAYLSREESDELVARGARIIDGRAKVIVQTSALLVEDVVARTRHAADCGADGVMLLPPFFEGPTSDDDVVAFYETASQGGLPIIGYNVPHVVGVAITPDLFRRLAEIPNFVTVKDSSGDLVQQTDLIRTGLPVMNGADPLVPYALYAGAAGLIWGGANFAPKACVAVVKAAEAGDWSKVREFWRALEPAMNLIWQGDYGQSVYAAAEMTGYGAGQPRRPFSPLPADKREVLRAALGGLIESEAQS
ncbi:dihydrodipicolinate synthase family protein (plasmid) [Paracoccus versutus]|uniref:4-hydroxy-tetrahydrodipicolinate synthase n=1 Tax=Paracoccus versutus TaxID=34007 RepID=A0AAQ0HE65_PARVE|nr:dihydrodipicolinate synthase family protein [Paracoccus versutus]KGJ07017.1 dihydrodipicolinate synthetase [Paracoccus versutus]REG31634.1 4-hydroxy-tetrahydrodipicolinate synthase [Paracoccus versutus]WEJ81327.1 dihydrodipicolinate synthase family protein [Paracoccus versutus]